MPVAGRAHCHLLGSRDLGRAGADRDAARTDHAWTTTPIPLSWTSNAAPCSLTGGMLALSNLPASGSVTTTQATPGGVLLSNQMRFAGQLCGSRRSNVAPSTPSVLFRANGTDRLLGEAFFLEWQTQANSCTPWVARQTTAGGRPRTSPSDLTSWTFCARRLDPGNVHIHSLLYFRRTHHLQERSRDHRERPGPLRRSQHRHNLHTVCYRSSQLLYLDLEVGSVRSVSRAPNPTLASIVHLYPEDTGLVVPHLPGSFALKVICFKFNSNETVESAPIERHSVAAAAADHIDLDEPHTRRDGTAVHCDLGID